MGFFYLKIMEKYNCTIDALDYLEIDNVDEGIHFSIKMYGTNNDGFDSTSIVLTENEVKKLILQLNEILNKNGK